MSRQSVAVVGSGVSGMTAAYLLQRRYDVTVFEARDHVGGNADTKDATLPGGTRVPVDVAFMAYGEYTYPNFTRLLSELEIATRPAQVAVDVVCTGCGFTNTAEGSMTPPSRGSEPLVWDKFLTELRRFPDDAAKVLASGHGCGLGVGEFLSAEGYSDYFFQHFIYPRAAPWFLYDADSVRVMSMELLVRALDKYRAQDSAPTSGWRAVAGGSRVYLRRIAEQLAAVHTNTPVRAIHRLSEGISIRDAAGRPHLFDRAVVAVPAPTALELLSDATRRERELLGAFRYVPMDVTLHTDTSVYPGMYPGRSSMCMEVSCENFDTVFRGCTIAASLLQDLDTPQPLIVSYNRADRIAADKVLAQSSYEHPVLTVEAFAAQHHLSELSGSTLAFAGSYFGAGVHEDGCASGIQAAEALDVHWQG